jgi:hypothetical protein
MFCGRRGRYRMVVGITTTYAISIYHYWCCEFESRSGRGVQHYVIKFVSDLRQVCGFLRVLQFPPPIKLTATILLALNTIKQKKTKKRNVLCLIVTVVQMLPVWLVTTNVLCLVDTKCPKCTMVNFSIWQNGLCLIAILWSDVLCV